MVKGKRGHKKTLWRTVRVPKGYTLDLTQQHLIKQLEEGQKVRLFFTRKDGDGGNNDE